MENDILATYIDDLEGVWVALDGDAEHVLDLAGEHMDGRPRREAADQRVAHVRGHKADLAEAHDHLDTGKKHYTEKT